MIRFIFTITILLATMLPIAAQDIDIPSTASSDSFAVLGAWLVPFFEPGASGDEARSRTYADIKDDIASGAFTASGAGLNESPVADGAGNWAWGTPVTSVEVVSDSSLSGLGTTVSQLRVTNPFTSTDEVKLDGIEVAAEVNVQADWAISNANSDAYIQNKPNTIAAVTSDATLTGDGTSGDALSVAVALPSTSGVTTGYVPKRQSDGSIVWAEDTVGQAGTGEANVQADWSVTDISSDAFILDKPPTITSAQTNKLAGIETGATADQAGNELVSTISTTLGQAGWTTGDISAVNASTGLSGGGNSGAVTLSVTTPFLPADRTKLDGIEDFSDNNRTGTETVALIDSTLGNDDWKLPGLGETAVDARVSFGLVNYDDPDKLDTDLQNVDANMSSNEKQHFAFQVDLLQEGMGNLRSDLTGTQRALVRTKLGAGRALLSFPNFTDPFIAVTERGEVIYNEDTNKFYLTETGGTYQVAQIDSPLTGAFREIHPEHVSGPEIAAGTETDARSFSPENIVGFIGAHAPQSSGLNQSQVDARITVLRPVAYTSAEQTKVASIAAGAEVNVQSDWAQTDSSADDFIDSKPDVIPDPSGGGNGQGLLIAGGDWIIADLPTGGGGGTQRTDESIQDVVGGLVATGGTIAFDYDDPNNQLSARLLSSVTDRLVISGGSNGQALVKSSGTNYDLHWTGVSPSSTTDAINWSSPTSESTTIPASRRILATEFANISAAQIFTGSATVGDVLTVTSGNRPTWQTPTGGGGGGTTVTASDTAVTGATIAQSLNISGTDWNLPGGGGTGGITRTLIGSGAATTTTPVSVAISDSVDSDADYEMYVRSTSTSVNHYGGVTRVSGAFLLALPAHSSTPTNKVGSFGIKLGRPDVMRINDFGHSTANVWRGAAASNFYFQDSRGLDLTLFVYKVTYSASGGGGGTAVSVSASTVPSASDAGSITVAGTAWNLPSGSEVSVSASDFPGAMDAGSINVDGTFWNFPSGGSSYTDAQADARVRAGVADWAEHNNSDRIPASKGALPAPGGGSDGQVALISSGAWVIGNQTGGGGTTDLTNIGSDVLPDVNDTRDIGSASREWAQGYFDEIHISDDIEMGDNSQLYMGEGNDIFLAYNGTANYLWLNLGGDATDMRITDNLFSTRYLFGRDGNADFNGTLTVDRLMIGSNTVNNAAYRSIGTSENNVVILDDTDKFPVSVIPQLGPEQIDSSRIAIHYVYNQNDPQINVPQQSFMSLYNDSGHTFLGLWHNDGSSTQVVSGNYNPSTNTNWSRIDISPEVITFDAAAPSLDDELVFADISTGNNDNARATIQDILDLGGGGGGLTDSEVLALIADWAEDGNTDAIPSSKIPVLSASKITSGVFSSSRLAFNSGAVGQVLTKTAGLHQWEDTQITTFNVNTPGDLPAPGAGIVGNRYFVESNQREYVAVDDAHYQNQPTGTFNAIAGRTDLDVVRFFPDPPGLTLGIFIYLNSPDIFNGGESFHRLDQVSPNNRDWVEVTPATALASSRSSSSQRVSWLGAEATEEDALRFTPTVSSNTDFFWFDTDDATIKLLDQSTFVAAGETAHHYRLLPSTGGVNADWTQTDSASPSYIEHKPGLGALATRNSVNSSFIDNGSVAFSDLSSTVNAAFTTYGASFTSATSNSSGLRLNRHNSTAQTVTPAQLRSAANLGSLATRSTVGTSQIDDNAVTYGKLSGTVENAVSEAFVNVSADSTGLEFEQADSTTVSVSQADLQTAVGVGGAPTVMTHTEAMMRGRIYYTTIAPAAGTIWMHVSPSFMPGNMHVSAAGWTRILYSDWNGLGNAAAENSSAVDADAEDWIHTHTGGAFATTTTASSSLWMGKTSAGNIALLWSGTSADPDYNGIRVYFE